MFERAWDFFVDTLVFLFMPLVCSYYTMTADPFLNVAAEDASGLEKVGNVLLAPVQYIFAGRVAVRKDGAYSFNQRFDYNDGWELKTVASAVALPPSLVLGTAVKGLSFLSADTRERYAAMKSVLASREVKSNQELYQAIGIEIGDLDNAEFIWPEGHARRPGDERHLEIEKKALADIAVVLNEAKIPWWVDCGTCLGTQRYGGVIPWDYDLDIAVLMPDHENLYHALQKLDKKKYIIQDWSSREHPKSFLKVYIRENESLVEFYHFKINPETREISYLLSLENNIFFPEWWKIRERRFCVPTSFETVFPLKVSTFDGIEVYMPNNPTKYLQRCYGENLAPAKVYDPVTGNYEKDLTHPYWQRVYAH